MELLGALIVKYYNQMKTAFRALLVRGKNEYCSVVF